MKQFKYDLFVSFSLQDKEVTREIVDKLNAAGVKTWCSLDQLRDQPSTLTGEINQAIVNSEYGLAVISPAYLEGKWTIAEWAALFAKEKQGEPKTLLHTWHGITENEILEHKPLMVNRFAVNTNKGIDHVAAVLCEQVSPGKEGKTKIIPSENRFKILEEKLKKNKLTALIISFLSLVRDYSFKNATLSISVGLIFTAACLAVTITFYEQKNELAIAERVKKSDIKLTAQVEKFMAEADSFLLLKKNAQVVEMYQKADSVNRLILEAPAAGAEIANKIAEKLEQAKKLLKAQIKKEPFNSLRLIRDLPTEKTFALRGVVFKMKLVKAGTFQMGCDPERDEDCGEDKTSLTKNYLHSVTLTKNYWMGETEVTQALYRTIIGENPSAFGNCDQCPIELVSLMEVSVFIMELNQLIKNFPYSQKEGREGFVFRLPTGVEWEFAARGGNKSKGYKYAGSNDLNKVAWYRSNSDSKTHSAAQKQANELGLYDMSGNVFEWCDEFLGGHLRGVGTDPSEPNWAGYAYYQAIRSGSFNSSPKDCRSTNRDSATEYDIWNELGFRLAGTLE